MTQSGTTTFNIDASGRINPEGKVIARGFAFLSDEESTALLHAETRDASASCADANGNGVAGLVELTIPFRYDRSSDRVLATVIPQDGEINESGQYPATIRFEGDLGSYEVTLHVEFEARPGGNDGRG